MLYDSTATFTEVAFIGNTATGAPTSVALPAPRVERAPHLPRRAASRSHSAPAPADGYLGGAIAVINSTAEFNNCTFENNTALMTATPASNVSEVAPPWGRYHALGSLQEIDFTSA